MTTNTSRNYALEPNSNKPHKNDAVLQRRLDEINLQGCKMTNETLQATNEMLRLTLQCEHAGAHTLAKIHAQGEQLNNVEGGMDHIHADLRLAEKDLTQIEQGERCCCFCFPCFTKFCLCCRSRETESGVWNAGNVNVGNTVKPNPGANGSVKTGRCDVNFIHRINNDPAEEKMNENLKAVSEHLKTVKATAEAMGTEISKQNTQIDRTMDKASSNSEKVGSATKRTNNLLEKK